MPKLFVHIGTHKTATTSVQRFFAQNRDAARRAGIWYPEMSVGEMPDHYAHHRLAHAMAGRDDSFGPDDVARFFDEVRTRLGEDEVGFISAEPLYRHVIDDPEDRDPRAGYERYAEVVKQCVGDFDVTVLVMLRRQDLFAESLYAEHVLSSGYTEAIEAFVDERPHLFDYEQRLNTWADAFGSQNIDVRVFEPRSFEHPIERIFVEWMGAVWTDDLNIGGRRNVTLPRSLVEYKRSINVADHGATVNASYRRWLERFAGLPVAESLPDLGKYYLDPKLRLEIVRRHEEGNRVVAERFAGRAKLFSSNVLDDLARYVDRPVLTASEHRRVTKQLFRSIAMDV